MITRDDINRALNEANSFKKSAVTPTPAIQPTTPAVSPAVPAPTPSPYLPENSLQTIGENLGMDFPGTAELQTMSVPEKIGKVGGQLATFPIKMILGLPRAAVQMLPNFVIQASKPIQAVMEGKPLGLESLSQMPNVQLTDLPLLNALPGSVKGFIDKNIQPQGDYFGLAAQGGKEAEYFAKYTGLPAPLAKFVGGIWATGSVASQAFADIAVSALMADTVKNALTPRAKLVEGQPLNTEPIKSAMTTENGKQVYARPDVESPSTYYSLSKDFASSKWGGSEKNTFWKVAPSTDGAVEMSVVRLVDQKAGNTININGMPIMVTKGKFGNEIKLQSEILQKPVAPVGGEISSKMLNTEGTVKKWGTRNQYYSANPFRKQLEEMVKTKNFDKEIIKKADRWEMEQVLKDKPAYLSDGNLDPLEILKFANDHGLYDTTLSDGTLIVSKNKKTADAVIRASEITGKNRQRELGLSLGYEDLLSNPQRLTNFEVDTFTPDNIRQAIERGGYRPRSGDIIIDKNGKKLRIEGVRDGLTGAVNVTDGKMEILVTTFEEGGLTRSIEVKQILPGEHLKITKSIIPRTVKDIVSEKFNDELVQLEALRESVESNPLKALEKYVAKSGDNKGKLPEVSGTATKGKFATKGDVIAADVYGYRATDAATPYLEDIRGKFEDWQVQKARLKTMEGELKERIKNEKFELKDQEAVNKFLSKEGATFEEAFGPVPKKPVGREAGITAPVKGMEKRLVTQTEIDSIDRISRVVGVDSRMTETIMRNLTGKKVAADLTRGEAYEVMKQLSEFGSPYIKAIPSTFFDRWSRTPRHWTARYQEKTGIPINDSWQRLEGADMLTKTKVYEAESVIRDIWGDYLKNPDARTAVRAYRLGDEASLLDNPLFTSAQKTDLVSIASKVDEFYQILGPEVGVPLEVFLQGPYSPEVQALGGKFTLYKTKGEIAAPYDITLKSGEKVPGSSFFAKQKRHGSVGEVISDEAELMNIYARAGYKHKFFDPALNEAKGLLEKLPDQGLKNHWASMVQEKMGYGGVIERFMNETVPKYLEKIPIVGDKLNLPADFARQFMNYSLGWVSANVMSQPATWFRDFLSYPTLGYAQMGSKFMGSSMVDFMIPTKRAVMWENAKKRGFILERGLSAEVEFRSSGDILGGKLGSGFSKLTETAIVPKSWSDNVTRVLIVDQSQKIFNDALTRYNKNPTAAMWNKFESDAGLNNFSLTDRNAIRQSLISGDIEGALNRFIRTNIDDSVWPYRQASSGRVFYGAGGKVGGFLLKWPFEYVSTIGTWVARGQWDKLIRLYGSVHALNETFKKEYGWDFSKSFLLGPVLGIGLSPLPKMAWNFLSGSISALQGNLNALDQNKDQIMQTYQAAIRPGGVMRMNVERLWQSYKAYKNGIVGPNDTLPVFNTRGQVLYYSKFSELFWRLWGFPTETMVGHSQLRSKERKESALRNIRMADVRENILDLLRVGDAEKLNAYVQGLVANGIKPPAIDTKSLFIPLDYKLFQQMTPEAKSIFGPQLEKLYAQ